MCGIAGIFHYGGSPGAGPNESVGLDMTESLRHRGPDGGGLLVTPRLVLGHRRLAILDLSRLGRQPMSDERQRVWLAYNGEIYNFRELRRELEQLGHQFRSHTDTEVVLRGYLHWGRDVVQRLNGMFAFALYDTAAESLWLVRDGVGIKPLFYRDDGTRLWFGSEIKAILSDPEVERRPDWSAIDAFFTFAYVPAPATGFEGIRQLLPGQWLLIRGGRVDIQRWFRLPYPDGPRDWSAGESVDRLDAAVRQAVARQMISDVPLGALLSGGLDSAAVLRAMHLATSSPVSAFTIGFDEPTFDESRLAGQVADRYAAQHHVWKLPPATAEWLPALVAHAEEPLADNSLIPVYALAEFARRRVTVALSGDGADELLAGYSTYRASRWSPWYRRVPWPLRHWLIGPLVQRLPPSQRKYGWPQLARRFVEGAEERPLRDHASWRQILSPAQKHCLYGPRWQSAEDLDAIGPYAAAAADAPDWLTPLERQLHMDLTFHLPNDMLAKVDRMSMAHSLEVRVPLLDMEVLATCLAIPARWKLRGRGKWVLRRLLSNDLPAGIVRRKKSGFLLPLESWLANAWQPLLREYLTPRFAAETAAFRWDELRTMLDAQRAGHRDFAYPLFTLLMFSLWWRMWMTRELAVPCSPGPPAAPCEIEYWSPGQSPT
jgi:asparagine synthase (glutamine-hydrolysing)